MVEGTFAGACRSRGRREAGRDLDDDGGRQDGRDDHGDVGDIEDADRVLKQTDWKRGGWSMVWRMRFFIIRHLKKLEQQCNAELHEVDDGHQGVGCYAWLNLHPPTLHCLHPLTYIDG